MNVVNENEKIGENIFFTGEDVSLTANEPLDFRFGNLLMGL